MLDVAAAVRVGIAAAECVAECARPDGALASHFCK